MAGKINGHVFGNGNGHDEPKGYTTNAKLLRLLAQHEAAAASVRAVLAMLNGEATTKKAPRAGSVIAAALALDEKRVKRPGAYKAKIKAQRARTVAVLKRFSASEPRPLSGQGIGAMVARGYLTKKVMATCVARSRSSRDA